MRAPSRKHFNSKCKWIEWSFWCNCKHSGWTISSFHTTHITPEETVVRDTHSSQVQRSSACFYLCWIFKWVSLCVTTALHACIVFFFILSTCNLFSRQITCRHVLGLNTHTRTRKPPLFYQHLHPWNSWCISGKTKPKAVSACSSDCVCLAHVGE